MEASVNVGRVGIDHEPREITRLAKVTAVRALLCLAFNRLLAHHCSGGVSALEVQVDGRSRALLLRDNSSHAFLFTRTGGNFLVACFCKGLTTII